MLLQRKSELTYADVTPKELYFNRRKFLKTMGIAGATALAGKSLFDLISPAG
ncbi:MAG: twin-arginine translocation signal domain-containing protein, partial [Terriglobales bacterium]